MPSSSGNRPDRRLGIIAEQSERLSRMVRQLLTVTRLESGALRPEAEVVALAPRVRRAWEATRDRGDPSSPSTTGRQGWLAVADPDQLDQVLWALLDNAVKYGRGTGSEAEVDVRARAAATSTAHHRGRRPGRLGRGPRAACSTASRRGQAVVPKTAPGLGPVRLARAVPGDGRRSFSWSRPRAAAARPSASTWLESSRSRARQAEFRRPLI